MRRRSGFTLTELVVTLAVLGMVTFFLTEVLVRQSRTYTVVDDVSEAQQSLRAVTGLIERELRMTGFMVPAGAAVCGWDMPAAAASDATPDVLYVTDSDAIDQTGLRDAELQYAEVDGGFTGTGVDTLDLSTLVVDPPGDPAKGFYDLDDDGIGDSDFLYTVDPPRAGGVIVFDLADPSRGVACGLIQSIEVATATVRVDFEVANGPNAPGGGGAAPGGTPLAAGTTNLVAVPANVYWVNPNAPNGPPQLIRNGMVLANDVEDLQVAFFFDADDDGAIDAGEYRGTLNGGVPQDYQSGDEDNRELREVRVTVVARTRSQDPDVLVNPTLANSVTQAAENRPVGAAADGFRRRAIALAVRPRNTQRYSGVEE
jgi:prepilin-type N-terminal cleavage/methylation domain-containing protein